MAGVICMANTGLIDTGAGAADSALTLMQIQAPTSQNLVLKTLRISSRQASSTALQDLFRISLQTDAGTASTTAQVPVVLNGHTLTPRTTFSHTFTAEPTTTTVRFAFNMQPMQGLVYPFTDLENMVVLAGARIGIVRIAGASLNYKISVNLVFEE